MTPSSFLVDLADISGQATASGPQWGWESTDLNLTLLTWTGQQEIAPHVNDEVDVVLIGMGGVGEVLVDEAVYRLTPGQAVLIAKGARRSMRCLDGPWSYLSVHRRRRGLWPSVRGEATTSS